MSHLDDIASISMDARRMELARILAIGVVRLMTSVLAKEHDGTEETPETSGDGLEDS